MNSMIRHIVWVAAIGLVYTTTHRANADVMESFGYADGPLGAKTAV